jgi:hypothetical protein
VTGPAAILAFDLTRTFGAISYGIQVIRQLLISK